LLSPDTELVISILSFLAFSLGAYVVIRLALPLIATQKKVSEAAREEHPEEYINQLSEELETSTARLRESISTYFESLESGDENSIRRRLVRAGFFSRRAIVYYFALRAGLACVLFIALFIGLSRIFPASPVLGIMAFSFIVGGLGLVIPNFYLDRMARLREEQYRRAFPDFMDMMIVCTDAGLSMEAAANRVSQEFLKTHKMLGIHLCIMMLEVRAGKRLREALGNLAERLHIPEARSLATLFKQSEELGSSLTQALRVYSSEMRQMRLLRAEEKANALPVKMVLPLAGFLFPVTMVIVVLPVMISLIKILVENAPI
jgi:tight adherence protein C